jgi:hypothetical protein
MDGDMDSDIATWVRENVHRLRTIDPDSADYDELEPSWPSARARPACTCSTRSATW